MPSTIAILLSDTSIPFQTFCDNHFADDYFVKFHKVFLCHIKANCRLFLRQFVGDLFVEDVFDGKGDELDLDFLAIGH